MQHGATCANKHVRSFALSFAAALILSSAFVHRQNIGLLGSLHHYTECLSSKFRDRHFLFSTDVLFLPACFLTTSVSRAASRLFFFSPFSTFPLILTESYNLYSEDLKEEAEG